MRQLAALDPGVVEKIAAGEVIDRPAAVVKELVENAIDAGARRIDVLLTAAGQTRIVVVDDGCGMTEADARLALRRHTTSKLRTIDDLFRLRTMGFRGEGLASVAAIAHLTIATAAEAAAGVVLTVSGGDPVSVKPAGCPQGTRVEVEDLFFNTPVRRKFLKSSATELAHVTTWLEQIACGFPQIHLTLTHDDHRLLDMPSVTTRAERVRCIVGRRAAALFSASAQTDTVSVAAYLTGPEVTSGLARSLTLLVNQRPVRYRPLVYAVTSGFGEWLPRGRYPLGAVYLDIDPAVVDINVHPQKVEVRFVDSEHVFETVRQAVAQAVQTQSWQDRSAARLYTVSGHREKIPHADPRRRIDEATRRFWLKSRSQRAGRRVDVGAAPGPVALRGATHQVLGAGEGAVPRYQPLPTPGAEATAAQSESARAALHFLGAVDADIGIYAMAGELLVVHLPRLEMALYRQQLAAQLTARGALEGREPSRPLVLAGDETQARRVAACQPWLQTLGFILEAFGGGSWAVRQVPFDLVGEAPLTVLGALLSLSASGADPRAIAEEAALRDAALTCIAQEVMRARAQRSGTALRAVLAEALPALPAQLIDDALPSGGSLRAGPSLASAAGPVILRLTRAALHEAFLGSGKR